MELYNRFLSNFNLYFKIDFTTQLLQFSIILHFGDISNTLTINFSSFTYNFTIVYFHIIRFFFPVN